jgi:hypothetical protein
LVRIFQLGIRRPGFGLDSIEKTALCSGGLLPGYLDCMRGKQVGPSGSAERKQTTGLSALGHVERKKKKVGPAEVLPRKHSKALLNFKTFIVYKYL